jgi:cytochrome c-type biogenesis protein
LFFVAGFSAVFIALGLAFSGGGMLTAGRANRAVAVVAGSVIAALGLNMIFGFLSFLNMEAKARAPAKPRSAAGAFVVGMAFGAGWTPCVGPILASILLMAARSGGAGQAALLLGAYSAGLALPFIAAGLFFERLSPVWAWFKRHGRGVRIVSGLLLIAIGVSMAVGRLGSIGALSARAGIALKVALAADPVAVRLWSAAVISTLTAVLVVAPLARRRPFARPWRIVALAILVALLALEAAGIMSMAGLVSDWLLFQGA